MKKHWLAVLDNRSLTVARAAVGKHQEMKVSFLADYKLTGTEDTDITGVKDWLQSCKIPVQKLKLAVSSSGLITRVITLPQMSRDDLDKIITNHIDQYFSLNVQNYLIDYRILEKYQENGKAMMNVLLAAYPRERMESIWNFCKDLSFEPQVIDLTADCLARIYAGLIVKGQTADPDSAKSHSGDIAIVSLNAEQVEFVLLDKGLFFLYTDMEFDFLALEQHYDQHLRDKRNLVREEILEELDKALVADQERAKEPVHSIPVENNSDFVLEDLFVPLEKLNEDLPITSTYKAVGVEGPGQRPQGFSAADMLNQQIGLEETEAYQPENNLWGELENNLTPVLSMLSELLSFFAARHFGHTVEKIYLTGEYCTLPNLAEVFAESLGIKTIVGFPHYWKPRLDGKGIVLPNSWQRHGSMYGLALRED